MPGQNARTAAKARRIPSRTVVTRDRLRQAATKLFAERGFHGTGIRDIAAAAGTTLSSLYYSFDNKEDLLEDIMFASTEPLRQAAARVEEAYKDPCARLAMLIEQHVWSHATDQLAKIVSDGELRALTGSHRRRVIALRDTYEAVWRRTIDLGITSGAFDVTQPKAVEIGLLEMCTAVSHWFDPSGPLEVAQLCDTYADAGLAMVRAHDGDRPIRKADLTIEAPDHFLRAAQA
jgi:AcrR family transcriptional regulator